MRFRHLSSCIFDAQNVRVPIRTTHFHSIGSNDGQRLQKWQGRNLLPEASMRPSWFYLFSRLLSALFNVFFTKWSWWSIFLFLLCFGLLQFCVMSEVNLSQATSGVNDPVNFVSHDVNNLVLTNLISDHIQSFEYFRDFIVCSKDRLNKKQVCLENLLDSEELTIIYR